ncbi:acetyltransferase (GNAT) family protein [Nostoc sp. PCC 7524]|uniref:GNAT family N-acetyltransferase n=1 Tax=Nostoc sp. (strain ATCC 29411 / PCC 7524) TaxID=28072 RepID=UPI00029F1DCE|nr:GNAT family N-acetyltransferase [Nostoc sp. PCC 7524]AFY50503.1 acetyltransferase (GNAT) family protein [Nostoc sp. PCC 7524]
MYNYLILENKTAASYENLTYPIFRTRLKTLDSDESIIALAVNLDSKPIGLALAEILTVENKKIASILSLFVVPEHRGCTIGKNLLIHIEDILRQQACSLISVIYVNNSTNPYWEKILKQLNWSTPQIRRFICSGSIINIKDAAWLKVANALSPKYTIFPWVKLTKQERDLIQRQQAVANWYPEELSPWEEEEKIEPLNSLGLRFQDQVIGWIVTHRITIDTIRYNRLFVRQDLEPLGLGGVLLAKAIQLQLESMKDSKAVFVVNTNNTPMVKFLHRRLAPYLDSLRQSWESFKVLD